MVILIRYNLESEGYTFHAVKNGKEAIDFCRQSLPDLIISDISMPEMDGFELREKLINDEAYRNIPFIFLTAKTMSDDHFRGLSLGVTNFLTKPFEPELLLLTIQNIFEKEE
jgi:CheY-like chemotaxis protein